MLRWLPVLVFLCAPVCAQQDPVTLRVETRAVQINVAVKDAQGRPVRGLRQEDFTVTDNGKRRAIQLFSAEQDPAPVRPPMPALPPNVFSNRFVTPAASRRITAILIDAVNTPFEHQSYTRAQAIKAVEQMTPGETIALYAMTPDLGILQDYTADRDRLLKALHAYLPRQPRMPDRTGEFAYRAELSGRGGGGPRPAGGRALAEFLMRERIETTLDSLRVISTHMAAASGRKSILWITAGFPPNRDFNDRVQTTLSAINESNVAVYPVDARGLLPGRGAMINIQLMQQFAESTGGQAYYNRNDLDHAIQEAVDDARYTYALAFYLTDQDLDGQFHELKVKVDRPGLVLHYRRGYSAVLDPQAAGKRKEGLEAELLDPVDSPAVGIDARLEIVPGNEGRSLRIQLMLDPATVKQTQPDGASAMRLDEMFVEMDARGRSLGKISETLMVAVPAGKPQGGYARTIPFREGAATLHLVVRDAATGRTGSLTVPLANLPEQSRDRQKP